jgi:hypothetical protein
LNREFHQLIDRFVAEQLAPDRGKARSDHDKNRRNNIENLG